MYIRLLSTLFKHQFFAAGFCLALIVWSLPLSTATATEPDKFGQVIAPELDARVTEARKMRLPYLKDVYDPKQSVELLEGVVAKQQDYYRAYFNLGLAYNELDEYEKAKAAFDAALKIRTTEKIEDASILNTAGWVSMKHGDFGRAEDLLLEAEKLTKGDGSFTEKAAVSNLGELYFLTQRFDEAEGYLMRSLTEFNNKSASYQLEVIQDVKTKNNELLKN